MHSDADGHKTATRAARLSPSADLKTVAEAAGVGVGTLIGHLRELPARGRCAAVAARAAASARRELRAVALSHPSCPRGVLRAAATLRPKSLSSAGTGTAAWAQRRSVDSPRVRRRAIRDVASFNSSVRIDAWGDPRTPPAVLAGCARDPLRDGVGVIAMNTSADTHLLECFAQHPDDHVRFYLAQNPACGSRVVQRLARDAEDEVRGQAASHLRCSQVVLRTLATDSDPLTRMNVARHPECPNDLFLALATDTHPSVRAALAGRGDLPEHLRDRLAGDSSWEVVGASANRRGCAESLLRRLSESRDAYTQICVASNQSTPTDVLQRLAEHPDARVRAAVAGNPAAPADLLQRLSGDDSAEVLAYLVDNPSCDQQLVDRLGDGDPAVHHGHRRYGCVRGLLAAVDGPDPAARDQIDLAAHPQCPPGQIKELAAVSVPAVRRAVALNPSVDAAVLVGLVGDEDPKVAAEAVRSLKHRWNH